VKNGGTVHVMLRVAGGMMIKVKTSDDSVLEIDVDPNDTVESMMRQLHQRTGDKNCQLELCLPEQLSSWDLITQLAAMINQRTPALSEKARNWHAPNCSVSDPNFGEFNGVDACFEHYSTVAKALDDVTVSINRVEETSPNVLKVWWTLGAALTGRILGIQPTGERFQISGISTHKIANG
jgi:hypothetical protein